MTPFIPGNKAVQIPEIPASDMKIINSIINFCSSLHDVLTLRSVSTVAYQLAQLKRRHFHTLSRFPRREEISCIISPKKKNSPLYKANSATTLHTLHIIVNESAIDLKPCKN